VGQGYALKVFQGGREVRGQVTLDLCGFRFPSESRRTGRLQVALPSGLAVSSLSRTKWSVTTAEVPRSLCGRLS
jgi:hypothetical protein